MSDKQRTFGQYNTPLNVADLLLGFCLRRPDERVLDPSCGTGVLLSRAALIQRWLADGDFGSGQLWGVELDPDAVSQAQELVPGAHIVQGNFFDLEPWTERLFDVVVGNPPYTRAEWFGRLGEGQPIQEPLPMFVRPQSAGISRQTSPRDQYAVRSTVLSKRAGLHAHFFVHGTTFLREGGRFGFVVPNSWLDVAYGERLKQYLLDHYKVLALIESNVERWFAQAKVNTCLIVLEKCRDQDDRGLNRIHMIRLQQPLVDLMPYDENDRERLSHLERLTARLMPSEDVASSDYVVRVVAQGQVRAEDRWGAMMRAPAVYRKHLPKSHLRPLKQWATVQRGYTTGANGFFYLDQPTVENWDIEPQFRRPLLKSLRQVQRRCAGPSDCLHEVLTIGTTADLSNTGAGAYVAWAEEQGIHLRRTCAARSPWYSLPIQRPASLLFAKGIWERHFAPLVDQPMAFDQQIYGLQLDDDVSPLVAGALLNSAWFGLQVELHGRINFGEGVLWLAVYELEAIRLPDPRYLPDKQLDDLASAFRTLVERSVGSFRNETLDPAWVAYNETLSEVLGFGDKEARAVVASLIERVQARQQKARSDL